ncbi:uncharacterized protein LOC9303263 isoform X1 [Arabidopsis lyrata subsp. lyrata]|uniref:uncharacterized protein LOC9303263 isoform X1 n=1 Tax=Arabidopsis lyrata subsp. lyrata TaxID=81972 RepID=UPI000A29C0E8|nr:uncharacterized protein LOC9303263 isoform X1 [Arabidopsis lyrata subsp. lyrata]|eukprot:XP_020873128.1 uncharacterized protein LOC9303263 isoform X1 [Arabidopsis lyrata subsp. lyrata]
MDLCNPQIHLEEKLRYLIDLSKEGKIEESLRLLPFWVLWWLWKSRNALVFNKVTITAEETLARAAADTKEWIESRKATNEGPPQHIHSSGRLEKWTRLARGWVKCNYDAAHREGKEDSGLGWIIRDSQGIFLHSGWGKFQGRVSAEEAECTTLIWAIQATWAYGYRTVVFEGDNLNLNDTINKNKENLRLQHYIQAIQQWRMCFTETKFTFKHREQNRCADTLAKKAITVNQAWCLYNSCPFYLWSLVNNDNYLDN